MSKVKRLKSEVESLESKAKDEGNFVRASTLDSQRRLLTLHLDEKMTISGLTMGWPPSNIDANSKGASGPEVTLLYGAHPLH